jgi:hypothetical protein
MRYALRRTRLPQGVASLRWNQWQVCGGISGNFRTEYAVYLLTEGHPGTIVELFDMSQGRDRVFAGIAAAAHHWDGLHTRSVQI